MEAIIITPFIPIIFNVIVDFIPYVIDSLIILWDLLHYVVQHPIEYTILVVSFYTFFEVLDHLLLRKRRPHLVMMCSFLYVAALEIYDDSLGSVQLFIQYLIIFTYMFALPRYYPDDKPVRVFLQAALTCFLFCYSNITIYCNKILHFHILIVAALTGGCISIFVEYYIILWIKGEEEILRRRRNSAAQRMQQ